MLEAKRETDSSLWSKMLEDHLSSKRDRIGNILLFGDPLSGKRQILDGLRKFSGCESKETNSGLKEKNLKPIASIPQISELFKKLLK